MFLVRDTPTDNLTLCILHGKNPEAIHNTHLQKLVFSAGFLAFKTNAPFLRALRKLLGTPQFRMSTCLSLSVFHLCFIRGYAPFLVRYSIHWYSICSVGQIRHQTAKMAIPINPS